MPQIEIEPVKCRLGKMSADGTSGASCHEFCLFEFPGCAGCPYAVSEKLLQLLADEEAKSIAPSEHDMSPRSAIMNPR
jgi:hypothetical protein